MRIYRVLKLVVLRLQRQKQGHCCIHWYCQKCPYWKGSFVPLPWRKPQGSPTPTMGLLKYVLVILLAQTWEPPCLVFCPNMLCWSDGAEFHWSHLLLPFPLCFLPPFSRSLIILQKPHHHLELLPSSRQHPASVNADWHWAAVDFTQGLADMLYTMFVTPSADAMHL